MLRKPNNVFSVILDDSTKEAGNLPAVGAVVTDSNLEEGAIVAVNVGMQRLNAASLATTDRYRIVQGKGAGKQLMISPVITKATATISTSVHKPAVQQITAVGFNGTSGKLPVANDTSFFIKIRKNDNDAANRSQPMSLFAGPVKTDGSGTQEELALALAVSGNKNFSDEPANGYLIFEVLCNNAGATDGTATTITVTNGSVAGTLNAGATTIGVGDLLRIGGGATTDEVYKIVALSGTSVTLDRPYTGATGAGVTIEYITSTIALTADFGIRISGVAANFDVNAFRDYYANRFTVTFSDPTTPVTHLQGAFNGNGVWQQVAMDEYMSYGFEGQNDMLAVPPRLRDQAVIEGGKYGCMIISSEESIDGLVSLSKGKAQVVVYLNLNASGAFPATQSTGEELAVDVFGLTDSDFEE
jgi:hypothetical protein